MIIPKQYRAVHPVEWINSQQDDNFGYFKIPHHSDCNLIFVCVTTRSFGWDHVAVTVHRINPFQRPYRCPTWEEMCFIKSVFWDPEDCVIQLHPPESDYINNHPYCLHLWLPVNEKIPRPPSIIVGVKQ